MNDDQKERLAELIDSIDNLASALKLPVSAEIHVEALKEAMPKKVQQFRDIFIEITGENPWF